MSGKILRRSLVSPVWYNSLKDLILLFVEVTYVRYYYRCPGNVPAPDCCRQLVYGADNVLRAGFGNSEVVDL